MRSCVGNILQPPKLRPGFQSHAVFMSSEVVIQRLSAISFVLKSLNNFRYPLNSSNLFSLFEKEKGVLSRNHYFYKFMKFTFLYFKELIFRPANGELHCRFGFGAFSLNSLRLKKLSGSIITKLKLQLYDFLRRNIEYQTGLSRLG